MKTSTSVKMAVLAGLVCALVALPALAFADPKPQAMDPAVLAALQHMAPNYQPIVQHQHLALDPDVVAAIVSAGATATNEPPVIGDGGGEEVVDHPDLGGPVSEDGADGRVERQTNETTPSITATPTVPHRPYLPYTGGDSTGWILAGVAAVALGVAIAALGYAAGLRREEVR